MTEAALTRRILAVLNTLPGVYATKMHGGPMMTAGLPDAHVCDHGRCVWLEVKLPGRKPTPIQLAMHERLRAAGATVAVVTSVADALLVLP